MQQLLGDWLKTFVVHDEADQCTFQDIADSAGIDRASYRLVVMRLDLGKRIYDRETLVPPRTDCVTGIDFYLTTLMDHLVTDCVFARHALYHVGAHRYLVRGKRSDERSWSRAQELPCDPPLERPRVLITLTSWH